MAGLLTDNAQGSEAAVAGPRWDRTNPWGVVGRESCRPTRCVATPHRHARTPRPGCVDPLGRGRRGSDRRRRRGCALPAAASPASWRSRSAPWVVMLPVFALAYAARDLGGSSVGVAVGGALLVRQAAAARPVRRRAGLACTALLGRPDAGAGVRAARTRCAAVSSAGGPGLTVLSPDLVVRDESGLRPARSPHSSTPTRSSLRRGGGSACSAARTSWSVRCTACAAWHLRGAGGPRIELRAAWPRMAAPIDDADDPRPGASGPGLGLGRQPPVRSAGLRRRRRLGVLAVSTT